MSDNTHATTLLRLTASGKEADFAMELATLATPALADAVLALNLRQDQDPTDRAHPEERARLRAVVVAGVTELARRASLAGPYGPTSPRESAFQPEVAIIWDIFAGMGTPEQPAEIAIDKPATLLLHLATNAVREATARHEQTVVAIVFCALWLEGYFNQMIEWIDVLHRTGRQRAPAEVVGAVDEQRDLERSKASLPVKIEAFAKAITGKPQDRGAAPYQDLALLVELRDAFVHSWPTRIRSVGDSVPLTGTRSNFKETNVVAVLRRLAGRHLLDAKYVATSPPLLEAIRTPEIARWALEAAQTVARFVADVLPTTEMRRRAHRDNALSGVPPQRFRLTGAGVWWPVSE